MQEWIIAMLVISVLLILRDMAKTILTGRMSKKKKYFRLEKIILRKKKWNAMRQLFRNLRIHFMECRTKRNT